MFLRRAQYHLLSKILLTKFLRSITTSQKYLLRCAKLAINSEPVMLPIYLRGELAYTRFYVGTCRINFPDSWCHTLSGLIDGGWTDVQRSPISPSRGLCLSPRPPHKTTCQSSSFEFAHYRRRTFHRNAFFEFLSTFCMRVACYQIITSLIHCLSQSFTQDW